MNLLLLICLALVPNVLAMRQENFADPHHPSQTKDVATFLMRYYPNRLKISAGFSRSSNINIQNTSPKSFNLSQTRCSSGGYTNAPPQELPSNSSINFAIASDTVFQGVQCTTEYRSSNGASYIYINVENPVVGSNTANATTSVDLDVITTVGPGMNNNVRFILKSK